MSFSNLVKTFWSGGNLETYMNAIEAEAAQVPGVTLSLTDAHIRTQAMPDKPGKMTFSRAQKLEQMGHLFRVIRNTFRISKSYRTELTPSKYGADPSTITDLESLAKDLGVTALGYTDVHPEDIFENKTAPYTHAIVYAVEMDKNRMSHAPGAESMIEVISAYRESDTIGLALVAFLRERGFGAYPGLSIGGMVDYPSLAERAGLGTMGYHGMLISPHDGARLRLSVVYTNISNLPEHPNKHLWIRDFCDRCRKCIRSCPPAAIYDRPQDRGDGGKTCIDADACRTYMGSNYTCGVCAKVCPFSNAGYDKIKAGFDKARAHERSGAIPLATLT